MGKEREEETFVADAANLGKRRRRRRRRKGLCSRSGKPSPKTEGDQKSQSQVLKLLAGWVFRFWA